MFASIEWRRAEEGDQKWDEMRTGSEKDSKNY